MNKQKNKTYKNLWKIFTIWKKKRKEKDGWMVGAEYI